MCSLCDKVKTMKQADAVDAIALAAAKSGYSKHLSGLLDKVLGTDAEGDGAVSQSEKDAFSAMKSRSTDEE